MAQLFGDYSHEPDSSEEFLVLGFSPTSIPLKQRWRNNGLSADFLADYLTTFFPTSDTDPSTIERQTEIKSAVSYIANELLENAMKFNDETSQYPINIQLHLYSDRIVFCVTNSIPAQSVDGFQAYLHKLIQEDPQELYIERLERNAEDDNETTSGLGLLTMMTDYMAKLGWKFETVKTEPEVIAVTTMVQIFV
ncbi:MAG TPA: ATP-binding protein [Thioploca sp.]|nr:ATP-binding protein [Thioploca sp.]